MWDEVSADGWFKVPFFLLQDIEQNTAVFVQDMITTSKLYDWVQDRHIEKESPALPWP